MITHHSELSSNAPHWLGEQKGMTAKQTQRHLHLLAMLVTTTVDQRALDIT